MDIMLALLDVVRDYMTLHNLNTVSFAEKIGCKARCLQKWLQEDRMISLEYAVKIARAMECSLEFLFGRTTVFQKTELAELSEFPTRLSSLIKRKGISKNTLAKICGVTSSTVSKWLLRGQLPKPDVACRLAVYFNCSVDYALGLSDVL